jgi:hypothetical protein
MILAVMTGSALMLAQFSAQAVITLTFEGLQQNEPILNYYNGGLGGFGSGPGANYGINFGADSLALNSGNYGNNPSQPGIAFFLTGPGDIMNVAAGFTTGFSFYYAAAQTGSVTVYDGLNGTGTVLATLSLAVTPSPYYDWVPVGVSFSGTAKSVNFSGVANYIGFDNVTLGAEVPTGVVPEPSTWLAGIGCSLSLLGGLVRKVRK